MDLMRVGIILMFAGGIIALENSKIGGYILAIGAVCLIVQGSEGTKEPKNDEKSEEPLKTSKASPADTTYKCKFEGNQLLVEDQSGKVVAALPAGNVRKQVGSNKK